MARISNTQELKKLQEKLKGERDPNRTVVSICGGTGCKASKADEIIEAFKTEMGNQGIEGKVEIRTTGCHGFCEKGPIVVVFPKKFFYPNVKVEDVPRIVSETVVGGNVIEELNYVDPASGERIVEEDKVPFYERQTRIIFENNGQLDPTSIEDYLALDGYSAIAHVLTGMSSEEVISEIKASGLRGRGGAGFPTGLKWETMIESEGDEKYIICNGDEGDPGAYMDRSILEGNPHSVIEGMLIGAYAMGAKEGYAYVREEYPLAIINLTSALEQAKEMGLLGENILGSDFSFDIHVYRGAGAFVCGEETALIASIMGKPGVPRQRPPYPTQKGLWGCPTNINNVETWANVSYIINQGSDWYSGIGTEDSKGTKIFSVVGKINNTGLVEVPMGITLKEVVFDIGGGIPDGKKFKAIQTGGPSGGCIPEEQLHLPIDFKSLTEAGSIMGSGGMIVMDEDSCMVDIARYFTEFTLNESCGKCVSCREGLSSLFDILTDITEGRGREDQIDLLNEVGDYTAGTSMCGLGQTAPNPVMSTLKYFNDEYLAHVKERRCPAHVCKELISYKIDEEKCIGCTKCAKSCPTEAITGELKQAHVIDEQKCIRCGQCFAECPKKVSAVEKVDRYSGKEGGQ
jgi:NADH-quinone oxidoreductase subunit F